MDDFQILKQALIENRQQEFKADDYWDDSTKNTFYREERETLVENYDVHPGVEVRASCHDRPLIMLDPTLGAFGSRTLTDYLDNEAWGLERVTNELVERTFLYRSSDQCSCTLTAVSIRRMKISWQPPRSG